MDWRHLCSMSAIAVLGVGLLPGTALSEQTSASIKDQLVGTWLNVSIKYKFPDGRTVDSFGPNSKGIMMLDSGGRMAFINIRSDLPKFASKDRTNGTPEENKAVVQGSFAYFGTYTVDEASRTLTVRYEASTFPNFEGMEAKRTYTLTGDELSYTNPVATIGPGVVAEAVWRRAPNGAPTAHK